LTQTLISNRIRGFLETDRTADSTMKTYSAKSHEVQRDWYIVDATGKVLGRVAAEIARRLRGKHKPEFTPHVDTGDYIVVVNADKLRVTGNKAKDKLYHRHSGYPAASSRRASRSCTRSIPSACCSSP
jgi:large subunit ribosomal protein L13